MESTQAKPSIRSRWLRPLLRLAVIVAGTYVAIVVVMMFFENALVYHPTSDTAFWVRPPAFTKDVVLASADGAEIHSWWLPAPGSSGALLYLHGNGGNLSYRAETVVELRDTLGLAVLIIDYPGFGKSTGSPTEQGCYHAADAAYDWLVNNQKIAPGEIVLFGKSLGGGVATELACRKDHRALALVKTYTSLPDVAGHLYPFVPTHLLMRNRFDSLSRIAACRRPVFVAHGTTDELIPFELGQRLYAAANEPKEFLAMPGHKHNDDFPPDFYTALKRFLDKHVKAAAP